MSLQITGEEDVLDALKKGVEIKLVLVDREEDCSEIIGFVILWILESLKGLLPTSGE